MEANELARELGFSQEGETKGKSYVIRLKDSNDYSRAYTLLDKSDLTELDGDAISLDVEKSTISYVSEGYRITLDADFDKDVYTVTIKEGR